MTKKAYTDLEQSKKLAEILPIESADMTWEKIAKSLTVGFTWKPTVGLDKSIKNNLFSYRNGYVLPCWSLAALIDILPLEVGFNKQTDGTETYCYIASYDARYNDVYTQRHLNVVDACVEMIVKLKERNLI